MSVLRRFRSAVSGRFITGGEAASTPDWSVGETPRDVTPEVSELLEAAEQVVLSRGYAVKSGGIYEEGSVSVSAKSVARLDRAVKAAR